MGSRMTTPPRSARPPVGDELDAVAHAFGGVAEEQVRRDHLISAVLAIISRSSVADDLVFVGGTALSRTLLPTLRLSEDIDLICRGQRSPVAKQLQSDIDDGLRRTYGRGRWAPELAATSGSQPASLRVPTGETVQVQLLPEVGYPSWPTERTRLEQRYSTVPSAELLVLTAPAFVAAKTSAWVSRRAARDLYDLWALADAGHFSAEAAALYRRHGPTGSTPPVREFIDPPSDNEWTRALSHQGRIRTAPADAAAAVASAWNRIS